MGLVSINPITVEVVRASLAHIANEMATVLRKTSYNMMIYEVRDYCVGIVDTEGNILSQNFGALPIFLADLGPAIIDGVRMHGKNGFQPGDVLLMNHPYVCGQHLNNVVVYTPFFHQGELVAFLAVRAHWIDIGGTRVGFGFSGTREIYEEGLQFRSLKLYRGEQPNQDIFQIITDNVRFAESSLGDLRAQIAACRVGDRGLGALVKRCGLEVFLQCVKTIWHQSEALAREQVARIKPGKYEAEALFDSDGVDLDRPVPLKVKVEVTGSDMTIDFSEISDQVPGSINSGESGAVAAARVAFKSLVESLFAHRRGLLSCAQGCYPRRKNLERDAAFAGGQLEPHAADGDRFDSQGVGAGASRNEWPRAIKATWAATHSSASIQRPEEDFSARRSWAVAGAGGRTKTARTRRCRCARATCRTRRWSSKRFTIRC